MTTRVCGCYIRVKVCPDATVGPAYTGAAAAAAAIVVVNP